MSWNMEQIRNIAESGQHQNVNGVAVDVPTAQLMVHIYDKLTLYNKERLESMGLQYAMEKCWELFEKHGVKP